jgi:hypothetical protein
MLSSTPHPLTPTLSAQETSARLQSEITRQFPQTHFEFTLRAVSVTPTLTLRWWDGPSKSVIDAALEDFRSRKWEWFRGADGGLYSEEWREAHIVVEESGLPSYRTHCDMAFELDRHFTRARLEEAARRVAAEFGVSPPRVYDSIAALIDEYGGGAEVERLRPMLGKFYDIDDGGAKANGAPISSLIFNDLELLPFL